MYPPLGPATGRGGDQSGVVASTFLAAADMLSRTRPLSRQLLGSYTTTFFSVQVRRLEHGYRVLTLVGKWL